MIERRDFLLGGMCAAGAVAAYALKPRRHVSLMQSGKKLADILPANFAGWTSRDVSDLVAPQTPDSLAARLYGETVGRIYQETASGAEVIMLMAHGDEESNELQLHRPEICYPAFGFTVSDNVEMKLGLGGDVYLPGRRMVARSSERQETIIYWTRLGEEFPVTLEQQRWVRLQTAMHHYIADGLLARFSVADEDVGQAIATISRFVLLLIRHVFADARRPLVGTERAQLLARTAPQASADRKA